MSELKPCPFCGRNPKVLQRPDSMDGYFCAVSCFCCGYYARAHQAATDKDSTDEAYKKAAERWNRRTPDTGNPVTENTPLSLEELRGMDGEPVWVETPNKSKSMWAFVKQVKENGDIRVRPDFHSCIKLPYSKVEFYRQKPEAKEEAE